MTQSTDTRILSAIRKIAWKSPWAGDWTMMPCSDWGKFYTREFRPVGRPFLSKVIFIFRSGKVTCWFPAQEIDRVARRLANYFSYTGKIKKLTGMLCKKTDSTLAFIKRNQNAKVTLSLFEDYLQVVRDYYQYHRQTRDIADALSPAQTKKFLPLLQHARVYAEPVFDHTLAFDRKIAGAIARHSGISVRQALFMSNDEVRNYFKIGKIPRALDLTARHSLSALVVVKGKPYIFVGKMAGRIAALLTTSQAKGVLRGMTAYAGKVKGAARIVFDPRHVERFNEGDILIASSTRPAYLPLMKKAGAFVTDVGGILSHAAIVARELKKPCIIGTKIATKVFKDGDRVEVDANKGIARKLK